MIKESIDIIAGIGKIDTNYGDISFNNQIDIDDLVNKISNRVIQPSIELQNKDKEIELLKKIISELENTNKDEQIRQYLEAGDYIEASTLMEKALDKNSDKLFEDEIRFIETTSLYSFEKTIEIIKKKLNKYQDDNLSTIRLTLSYADMLLRYGKIGEAQEKYASVEQLSKYKLHFLKSNKENYLKIGITKSDGTQIDNIHSFDIQEDNNKLEFLMSIQTLLFASNGLARCFISSGLYHDAYHTYIKSYKYALISSDNDYIENAKESLAFVYYALGDYDNAINYYNDISDETPNSVTKYQILTHIYSQKKDMKKLHEVVDKGKKNFELLKSKNIRFYQAGYYESLGKYYLTLQEYKKSEIYYLKAIDNNKSEQQIKALADIYPQIAEVYKILADMDKAKYYYEETIKIATKHNFYSTLAMATHNYALTKLNVYERIEDFKKALALNKSIGKFLSLANNLAMLAEQYRQLKQYKKAKKYIKNSNHLFRKMGESKMIHYNVYYDLMALKIKDPKGYFSLLKLSNKCENCYKKYDAYMNLAEFYMKESNLKQALKTLYRSETILNSCNSCKDSDKLNTYVYIFQMYLNLNDYKNYKIYMTKASQYATAKEDKLSLEVFKMIFFIEINSDINNILTLADSISLDFLSMESGNIELFFKAILPILIDNELYDYGHKYSEKFLPIIAHKSFEQIDYKEAMILSHIGQIYGKSFLVKSYLETWTKAVSYLTTAGMFFQNHINQNEKNFFYFISISLNLAGLHSMANNREISTKIYNMVYDSNIVSEDIWEIEPFKSNKTLYHSGMVNYVSNLRLDKSFDKAIEISKKNIRLLEKTTDIEHLELALSNLALIYEDMELYDEALINHFKALAQGEKAQNFLAIAHAYEHIGLVYKKSQKTKLALEYFNKALYSYEKIKDENNIKVIKKYIKELE